jgi:hypothetical protein
MDKDRMSIMLRARLMKDTMSSERTCEILKVFSLFPEQIFKGPSRQYIDDGVSVDMQMDMTRRMLLARHTQGPVDENDIHIRYSSDFSASA